MSTFAALLARERGREKALISSASSKDLAANGLHNWSNQIYDIFGRPSSNLQALFVFFSNGPALTCKEEAAKPPRPPKESTSGLKVPPGCRSAHFTQEDAANL